MTKKKKRKIILVVGIFIAIFGSFLAFKISSPSEPLETIGNAQMETMLSSKEKKDVFVYVGRPTCPECQKFEPILKETLTDEYKTMYYYNTDVARKDNEESLQSLASELGVEVVPTIVKISNGKVVSKLEGIKNQKAILEFLN
ncbi:hypothetical protein A5844_000945 [Enterococcus sp. 10A9_DIV0425]|uniref:Thioredoxin domain-containing protein n=1 Tax=Candidatus Enterococcus wittei TaxID=1987383 RepID=A0A242JZH2_9ENTE|nr:thioredoxin family protein [Enterococcus sp. 10A9_DIV0425]OTP10811.1 hypothetical protein A5844_000945 [Enterococcus sp. 10A9_DIV0425]THE07655.1 thioredoxin family protein [Enterococcus hirae]